ncbi:class I SAM-dependent DNA methyltransferase [Synechococcus sp. CS-603]|uniref:class I SAM-dependent DNA methyltransferase n=1 Tax=Synechococcus sp. CS-603 TaxID=2847981 RepID=UPI00223C3D27|nr:class I SAM-dependent DNA methyltransferase [Synechococcus sp. CS-603]MCT0201993.1 type I restriction-modification system subunit M [Synechococcus sp. CS-603]
MADQEHLDDFLEALEKAGSPVKNPALRQALGWEEPLYEDVKAALVAKGIVTRGRGRSDSVSLAGAEPVVQQAAPAKATRKGKTSSNGTANLGFEAKLWLTADKLRNNMDAAEYKHVVLGLIFLKYISDSFEEHRVKLLAGVGDYEGANPEDPDEYKAENVFWVPAEARWSQLQAHAKQATIGKLVDDAMVAIERDNPRLKGVLPKDYARAGLDKQRLGELIDVIATIELTAASEGEGLSAKSHRSVDLLGRVYEYFLTRFASAEGKNGGQFYTPSCVVRCLVEMLEPYKGRIYDPCCGSGGMFVQSEKFVESHGGRLGDISIYGQESNATTRRLAVMNLALRGIEADFGPEHADSFRRDIHPDLRADYVIANPPFNDSDWFRKDDDVRWQYGVPPKGNANFAWVQHFIHHLAPRGMAGFVLANGSMSSNQSGEGEIRRALIEADLVDCMVALPGQLFYSTQIPVCLWFLTKSKAADGHRGFRDRRGHTLFIDARKLGSLIDRVHRELLEADLEKITSTYHHWRGVNGAESYDDVPGFCKSATTAEIAAHGHVLTPGRYVGAEEVEDDGEPFEVKMPRLVAELEAQYAESAKLEQAIRANLRGLGYGG